MDPFLSMPLFQLVNTAAPHFDRLEKNFSQVQGLLEAYAAEELLIAPESITADTVVGADGTLTDRMLAFIDGRGSWDKSTKVSERSRLKKVVQQALAHARVGTNPDVDPAPVEEELHEALRPLWEYFPRKGGKVTENGRLLIKVLTAVAEEHEHVTHERLLDDLKKQVMKTMRRPAVCPIERQRQVSLTFYELRKKMNTDTGRGADGSVPLDHLPHPLKEQVETFKENAERGLTHDAHLVEQAKNEKISPERMKESSVRRYLISLCKGLTYIDYPETFSIEDLMKVEYGEFITGGKQRVGYFNRYVNQYREREKLLVNPRSGYMFDTSSFKGFITAVKKIAAFNEIFHLHREFRDAHKVRLDKKRSDDAKKEKKLTFDFEWLEGEIRRLSGRFKRAIEGRKFDPKTKGVSKMKAIKEQRFCLFFVTLVTLRYMGFRQQAIRDCVLGDNIIFHPDGSIEFKWPAHKVKNEVDIKVIIRDKRERGRVAHRGTHAVLLDTLKMYHDVLYPFLATEAKNGGVNLNGQFFLKINVHLKPSPFPAKDVERTVKRKNGEVKKTKLEAHVLFREIFTQATRRYINYKNKLDSLEAILHPHFFRGFVIDWLVHKIKLRKDLAAGYLGDSEETVSKYYLAKNQPRDGTPALDFINQVIEDEERREKSFAAEAELKAELKAVKAELKEAKKTIREKDDVVKGAVGNAREDKQKRLEAERKVETLEALLAEKDSRIEELLGRLEACEKMRAVPSVV